MAARDSYLLGVTALLAGVVASQFGAGLGASLIPLIGPFAAVSLRQIVASLVLLGIARPRLRGRWRAFGPALVLGAVMAVMNSCVYLAIDRLGLGLTITLEFVGPLAIILISSRRIIDIVAGVAAGIGVLLVTDVLGTAAVAPDPLGILFALTGAAAWASYILLNRHVGRRLAGLEGSAIAATTAAVLCAPAGFLLAQGPILDAHVLLLAVVAGLLSSALPYGVDMYALRRIPPRLYGMIASLNPAAAVVFGVLLLGETLGAGQVAGVALVILASILALGRGARDVPGRAAPIVPAPQ